MDFEGKTYVGWGSPAEEATVRAVMARAGADPSTLNIVSFGDEDFFALAKTNVDIAWIFYAWDGIRGETLDFPMNYLPIADLHPALDFYTPVIIASESTIDGNPELVKKFLAATAKGYVFAAENAKASAEIFSRLVPDYDADFILRSQEWLSPKYIDDAAKWGVMDAARWDAYTQFMLDNGLISKGMPANEAFTNDLLP
jgi:ABC-type nitrate/sulfonate/bicarbonate transport system substrate-binding protein